MKTMFDHVTGWAQRLPGAGNGTSGLAALARVGVTLGFVALTAAALTGCELGPEEAFVDDESSASQLEHEGAVDEEWENSEAELTYTNWAPTAAPTVMHALPSRRASCTSDWERDAEELAAAEEESEGRPPGDDFHGDPHPWNTLDPIHGDPHPWLEEEDDR